MKHNLQPNSTVPTTAIEEIDAQTASYYLAQNTNNRPISQHIVARYATDMCMGRWAFTGEAINFAASGRLLNGQHRLSAIVEAEENAPGIRVPFVVVRGLPDSAQLAMDQGRKRSAGQQLALGGIRNSSAVAAAAKLMLVVERGLLFKDNHAAQQISTAMIEEWVSENMHIYRWWDDHSQQLRQVPIPPSHSRAGFALMLEQNQDEAEAYLHALASGEGLYGGQPELAVRNYLTNRRIAGQSISDRASLVALFRGWNALAEGKKMTTLRIPAYTADTFPWPVQR